MYKLSSTLQYIIQIERIHSLTIKVLLKTTFFGIVKEVNIVLTLSKAWPVFEKAVICAIHIILYTLFEL